VTDADTAGLRVDGPFALGVKQTSGGQPGFESLKLFVQLTAPGGQDLVYVKLKNTTFGVDTDVAK
jgi:hypothetical protein